MRKIRLLVNEVFTGKRPLKDIAQSPLQVAVKCGEFEIIDLLLENGADPDFMEDQSKKPENTSASYFMSMSILHDAIIGAFHSLVINKFERAERFVRLIERLLEMGADPNKVSSRSIGGTFIPPVGTLVSEANYILSDYTQNREKVHKARQYLLEILSMLKEHGAVFDQWLDSKVNEHYEETFRQKYLDDFIPREDKVKDPFSETRAALQEFFKGCEG